MERLSETNDNYEIVMQDVVTQLFPPKVLQSHKKYLCRGLYKHHNTKIL